MTRSEIPRAILFLFYIHFSFFTLYIPCCCINLYAKEKSAAPSQALCEGLILQGRIKPDFTSTEKKLICGDQGAWRKLPIAQIKFNISNFLQTRGYLHPSFLIEHQENAQEQYLDTLIVNVGEPTRVGSFTTQGGPPGLEVWRHRGIVGATLTPQLLGSLEQWITQRLSAIGYPCPKVTARADSETGAVVAEVDPGPLQNLTSINSESVPGVTDGMLSRYDAFQLGDLYNADLLTVTMNRITSLNLLQATYFTTTCTKSGAVARQEITAGPPRLVTFGIGIDTEGVIQLRSTWRNSRLDSHASMAQASVQFSSVDQNIDGFINWYNFPFPSRRFIHPSYKLQHLNLNAYEIISSRGGIAIGTSYDRDPVGLQFLIGPMIELDRTLRGSGVQNPNLEFAELEASLRVQSHLFEYWATDPRAGYSVAMVTDFSAASLGSSSSAQRLNLTGEALWNYREYDPPLWIFGLRGGIATTISSERPGLASKIPANFFWYLGGSGDLRGFALQSIPSLGAMTDFYLDPELRLTDLPLFGIQPFVFCDFGMTGLSPVSLDSPLLYSPGIGLRYKSPFGVFRTTLARGYPLDTPGGWNFYFSFGEEF